MIIIINADVRLHAGKTCKEMHINYVQLKIIIVSISVKHYLKPITEKRIIIPCTLKVIKSIQIYYPVASAETTCSFYHVFTKNMQQQRGNN